MEHIDRQHLLECCPSGARGPPASGPPFSVGPLVVLHSGARLHQEVERAEIY